jgi:hypothetical protein
MRVSYRPSASLSVTAMKANLSEPCLGWLLRTGRRGGQTCNRRAAATRIMFSGTRRDPTGVNVAAYQLLGEQLNKTEPNETL